MIIYKFQGKCSEKLMSEIRSYERNGFKAFDCESMLKSYNDKFMADYKVNKKYYISVTDASDRMLTLVATFNAKEVDVKTIEDAIVKMITDIVLVEAEEISLEEFKRELARAHHMEWNGKSEDSLIKMLGLKIDPESYNFLDGPPYRVEEKIYSAKGVSRKKSIAELDNILASKGFYDEIERIYSSANEKRFMGHPVHYLINAGDRAAADEMIAILIPALMKNKRLLGGRVCDILDISARAHRDDNFYNIFSSAQGSTVVINLSVEKEYGVHANSYHELLENIGKKMNEFGNETLFIFVDISGKRSISDDAIAAILANADMVRIDEGYGDRKQACEYLKRLAKKTEYDNYTDEELFAFLAEEKTEYTVSDIYHAYNKWYGSGLKSHVYKAYKDQDIVRVEVKKKECKPYEELNEMIGLSDVKRVTDEIIATARMQRIRKSMGLDNAGTSMHMLFAGNPGTAKTTVARLMAQILKDEEVLKNGHIVECGRQDLVARFVGWTAKTVEEKFRAARGGILFIDEAYSLVEEHNSFGTEAINTIVQMMENFREEVIVIFAGYPKKMQEFLDKNEGLRSRISFHLDFSDYDENELTDIMKLMLKKRGYKYENSKTLDRFKELCKVACREKDFGNGRFVRNLIDHAILRQSNRLLADNREISKEDAVTLVADDFELLAVKRDHSAIGFV